MPAVLYSPDLKSTLEQIPLHYVSPSGQTVGELKPGRWKLYHLGATLESIREGNGTLLSVSDEAVVFREDDTIRTETLSGDLLGSFSVSQECFYSVQLAGGDTLYLGDYERSRLVDFSGKELSHLYPSKGWGSHTWSEDGKRVLFHHFDRKISFFRGTREILVMFAMIGLGVADEQDNREEVQVIDAASGRPCFDWKQRIPEGSGTVESANISPSGEFVAVAADGTLSIYQLPAVCDATK
jgi:hypothetical protein